MSAKVGPSVVRLVLLASAACVAPAWGQEREGVQSRLEDIVVTAQRRSENLQDVPIAVSAFTATALEQKGVTSSVALEVATPGLVMTRQVSGSTPFLRGVGAPSATTGTESPVATYVDGVYYPSAVGNVLSFNNIERVEVLKGPQGTLFGRNATGGLISITTRDPGEGDLIKGMLSYGNYDTMEGSLYASGGSDRLAADISAYFIRQSDGFGRNVTTGMEVNRNRNIAVRSKVVFRPSEDDKLTATVEWSKDTGDLGLNYNAVPGALLRDGQSDQTGTYNTRGDEMGRNDTKTFATSLRYEHDFDWGTFSSLTAYRQLKGRFSAELDGTPIPILGYTVNPRIKTFQQEFPLVGDAGPLNWTTGLFFYDAAEKNHPIALKSGVVPTLNFNQFPRQDTRSYAAFGQGTFPLTDTTSLTAGLRYTIDKRRLSGQFIATEGNVIPVGTVFLENNDRKTFKKLTWRLVLDHKFSDDIMTYVSYNRGFKSGLFNLNDISQQAVNSETLDAFEFGLKSELFGRIMRINLAAFHYKYKDIQLSKITGGSNQLLLNAASARINGFDLEVVLAPPVSFGKLEFNAGMSVLESKYGRFLDGPVSIPTGTGGNNLVAEDLSGRKLIRAPDWTLSLGANLTVPVGSGELGLNGSYYHNSGFFWEPDHRLRQSAYDVVNGQIQYSFGDELQYRVAI